MKKFYISIFVLFAALVVNAQIFYDGFETYDDFVVDTIGTWITIDNDGLPTWGSQNYDFPNEQYTGSYIIFNPSQTTPPATGDEALQPHSGDKFLACFSAVPDEDAGILNNDDWIISEEFVPTDSTVVSLWVKTYTAQYGLERYNIYLMDGTSDEDVVVKLNPGQEYDEAPLTWTQVSYNISDYAGQTVRLAIQCVSADAFIFLVDDVLISDGRFQVTFNVDMSNAILEETFNPDNDSLFVTGSYIDWAEPGTNLDMQLMCDPDGDSIYTLTVLLAPGDYEYKYFINPGWENGEWDGDPNRSFSVDTTMELNDVFGELDGGDDGGTGAIEDASINITLGPNPVSDVLYISADGIYNVELIDMTGKEILNTKMQSAEFQINMSEQNPGVYILRLTNEVGTQTYKVIKK